MCVRKLTILSATLVSALCLQGSVSIRAGNTTTVTTTEVQSSMEDQSSTEEVKSAVEMDSTEITSSEITTEETAESSTTEKATESPTTESPAVSKKKTQSKKVKRVIYALNNIYKDIDYKLDQDSLDKYNSLVADGNAWIIAGSYDDSQNLNSVSSEESWLISNNILSRRVKVFTKDSVQQDETKIGLSDFWMMLYKTKYGVIDSRPVVVSNKNDYYYYVSPNVYELYFKELLDKGLINKEDFNDKNGKLFLGDYGQLSSNNLNEAGVGWSPGLGYANSKGKEKNVLGYSIPVNSKKFSCSENKPNYFKNEELLTLDALKCIETFLRSSEKDMTKLEASIVSYKYGVSYLSKLSESDKETVQFLVAKGILNFEDQSEMINLYGPLTNELAYKLLYRVANQDARFTFSEVQLTDSDSAWQNKGYGEDSIKIATVDNVMYDQTVTDSELQDLLQYKPEQSTGDDGSDDSDYNYSVDEILGLGHVVNAQAKSKLYKVIKILDCNYNYNYSGVSISKLVADKSSWTQEISDAKQDNITTVDGDDLTVNIITFKVQAKNYATAVMYVDNNISLDSDLNVTQAVGYTTVSDDNEEITLISEDTIRESLPNITIVEDKVLTNTVTGAQAVILTDTGYALVGNQIIVSDTLMETDINGKVYYNLDIICYLLSNAQLRSLTTKELYIVENAKSEKTVDFYSSLDVKLGQVYTLKRGNTRYYNASNISGVSKLIRKFTVIDGDDKIPVYFILNLSYVVPSLELFENYKLDSFNDSDNSLAKMSEIFYTKPTTTALVDWWDSNYGMTNSLCNFMYGTKGVEYVKSGYVVPSMVVLRTSAIKDNTISSIFTSNGFQPDATTKKYCESSTKWWKKYYGNCMSTDYLNALANQTRTIKFYDGKKSGSGMDYESKFYVTDSGIVYESVGADDRITYKDKSLRIKTRTSSQATINKDTVFSYGGNEWIFLGTTADGSKYKIIPNFTVAAFNVATVGSSSGELYQSTANANVSDSWNATVNNVDKLYSRYFSDSMTCSTQMTWNDHPAAADLFGYSKSLTDKDFYYVYGNTIVTADGVAKAKAQGNSIKMLSNSSGNSSGGLLSVIDGKHLRICPILYLDTDKYSFYSVSGDFHLVEGNIAKTLNLNNVFTVGMSRSVSDSIVAKYTNTVELNSLVQGQKVIIGDIVYTCKNDSTGNVCFVSDPITDIALVSSLVSSAGNNDNDAIKSKIVALFVGQKIQYGGLSYNLGSFIEDAKIGDKIADGADKLLYCSGKSYYVYSNGTSYTDLTRSCTSAVIQLKFSNGLLVMPLNSKLADYTLLYRSTISGNDKLDDIPFYGENLSYTSEGDYDLTLGKSKYRISQFYRETKDNFKKMMKDAFAGDLINFIWAIIFYFASYVTIILWILYVILHYGIGLKILQVVSLPVGKDRVFRRGFDIVKILSLGIYDLDSDPSLARTVITSFCSFVVAFAIVAWIPH